MLRSISRIATLALLVGLASRAFAQDPLAAADHKLAGSWKLDVAGSDTIPTALRSEATANAPVRRPTTSDGGGSGAGVTTGSGGGSGGRGGGGGGGRGGRGGGGGGAAMARGGGGNRPATADGEQMSLFMDEIAPSILTIEVEDAKTTITAGISDAVSWTTDKKKRETSTSKGGLFDMESSWWTKTLQTIRTLANGNLVQRDMKVSADGNSLEVKVHTKASGKKSDFKLKYTRAA